MEEEEEERERRGRERDRGVTLPRLPAQGVSGKF
jgi:hypothetical protein